MCFSPSLLVILKKITFIDRKNHFFLILFEKINHARGVMNANFQYNSDLHYKILKSYEFVFLRRSFNCNFTSLRAL
jgi:hypothetical protein